MSLFCCQVFALNRGTLLPDPAHDAVQLAAYSISIDADDADLPPTCIHGAIMVASEPHDFDSTGLQIEVVDCEEDLYVAVAKLIRTYNPDILVGYDVQRASWGFMLKRASHLGITVDACDLSRAISRVPFHRGHDSQPNVYNQSHSCDVQVAGRITMNVWRVVRAEVTHMRQYNFEAACLDVLRKRVPRYAACALTTMYQAAGRNRQQCIEYFAKRAAANLELLEALDVISKCSEHARVMGIDFESVSSD